MKMQFFNSSNGATAKQLPEDAPVDVSVAASGGAILETAVAITEQVLTVDQLLADFDAFADPQTAYVTDEAKDFAKTFSRFLTHNEKAAVPASTVYALYGKYCDREGKTKLPANMFGRVMSECGLKSKKRSISHNGSKDTCQTYPVVLNDEARKYFAQ